MEEVRITSPAGIAVLEVISEHTTVTPRNKKEAKTSKQILYSMLVMVTVTRLPKDKIELKKSPYLNTFDHANRLKFKPFPQKNAIKNLNMWYDILFLFYLLEYCNMI